MHWVSTIAIAPQFQATAHPPLWYQVPLDPFRSVVLLLRHPRPLPISKVLSHNQLHPLLVSQALSVHPLPLLSQALSANPLHPFLMYQALSVNQLPLLLVSQALAANQSHPLLVAQAHSLNQPHPLLLPPVLPLPIP